MFWCHRSAPKGGLKNFRPRGRDIHFGRVFIWVVSVLFEVQCFDSCQSLLEPGNSRREVLISHSSLTLTMLNRASLLGCGSGKQLLVFWNLYGRGEEWDVSIHVHFRRSTLLFHKATA